MSCLNVTSQFKIDRQQNMVNILMGCCFLINKIMWKWVTIWYNWRYNTNFKLLNVRLVRGSHRIRDASHPRKFKRGICCGGHLAITYGGELLYLQIFLLLSPPSNFVERELPFPHVLKSHAHIDYRAVNHAIIMCADRAKSEVTITRLYT